MIVRLLRGLARTARHVAVAPGFVLALASALPATAGTPAVGGAVSRITDGDTFRLRGVDRAIRVWGLDAPERGEAGAAAATSALSRLISGRSLSCRIRDIDRYGRIVGQCFLADGRDIAAEMIAAGVAREYCRFSGGYYGTCRRR